MNNNTVKQTIAQSAVISVVADLEVANGFSLNYAHRAYIKHRFEPKQAQVI